MSTREYADLRGITVQAVNKAIENSHKLPGVVSHSKSGRYRILMVDKKKILKK
jgi:predicted transcriptional regulator